MRTSSLSRSRSSAGLWVAALLLLPVALAGQEAREAIEAKSADFEEAWAAGDTDALVAQYTEDAVLYPPGAERVEGHEGIRSFWKAQFGEGGTTIDLTTQEVHATGDAAVEIGGYVITGPEDEHLDHGKYMVLWKKADGSWKLARDIWNSSMSP